LTGDTRGTSGVSRARGETFMPTSTVEDYLKTLYHQQQQAGGELVAMGAVAAAMGVVPGTATSMVKALADSGLVEYEPRGGVRLSPKGEKLALHVLRRHRLVELFLVEVLGLDWSEVDEEAEELEHAISDKVLAKIDALLGHPEVDPHGDPIPSAKGKLPERRGGPLRSLIECEPGRPVRVARVLDQNPAFLQFVERNNLKPGTEIVVKGRDDVADAVAVHPRHHAALTLGSAAAAKILVEAA
jgi:DtxR family transcriptional regulator, Mn-dependent transcriptional regulator